MFTSIFIAFRICFKLSFVVDARGGFIHSVGEDHAGLQDEGDVQAEHGGAGAVHVPTRHSGPGAHS